jgi:hypothetical protein
MPTSAGTVGRPMRCRLFQAHHSRKPRRCQAMTVSGLRMTSAVRRSVQMRESRTQSQRSVFPQPDPRRPRSTLQHLQLVPQRQDFELQCGARTRRRSQGHEEGQEHRHDCPEAHPSSAATSIAATRTDFSVQALELSKRRGSSRRRNGPRYRPGQPRRLNEPKERFRTGR